MVNDIKKDATARMAKSIETLKDAFTRIRTGRANTNLLDHIVVSYYGSDVPLKQISNVTVSDSRTLMITPYEKNMVQGIEKAIMQSDLGLNPATSGNAIRVPLPSLTEERRRDLIRVVRHEAENSRVAIRNVRRDANGTLKELLKEKDISEDDERRAEEDIQKLTDKYIAEVDKVLAAKETDLMAI